MTLSCPVCDQSDGVRCKDDPRFYLNGRLWARCFHQNSHPNGQAVNFFVDNGEQLARIELSPQESLYQIAQSGPARGFGAAFLAEKCGVYLITAEDVIKSTSPVPSEKWLREWEGQAVPVTIAPLYLPGQLAGLEVRAMVEKASPRPGEPAPKTDATRKTVGAAGVFINSTRVQPETIIVFAGIWDAISAAWDALQADEWDRYAFASVPDGFNPKHLKDTLESFFPNVPRLMVSDQDPSGQKARAKFSRVCTMAILPGTGLVKDYRESDPKKRWKALMEGVDHALEVGNPAPSDDAGIWKIARRAVEGTLRAKALGLRDLEAWRFGQRCAGMCRAGQGGRRFFSIRANIYGEMVTAEGQYDFQPVVEHRTFRDLERENPDLAAVINAGATEHPLSPQWRPPMFLEDGSHWSEIPKAERIHFTRARGWEPWDGKDPGTFQDGDLEDLLDRMAGAYRYCRIPNAPDSEVGLRVTIWCLSAALCALRAEEIWSAKLPTGFLPWIWFYGGPATGKGIAMKIIAACLTGELRTYGSQRFGGDKEYDWLTESVLHLPICFRDELDVFMKGSNVEDLKTFTAGEALQLRKKFGTDMSISPRPVIIASNSLHINQEDEATLERITLVELQSNPLVPRKDRNNAFESFHLWLDADGRDLLYRLTLHLYKQFRLIPITRSSNSRSAMLDGAVSFLAAKIGVSSNEIWRPSTTNKEEAVLKNAPWYARLLEYTQHEIGTANDHSAKALSVWALHLEDPNQKRTFYRYLKAFQAAGDANGDVPVGPFSVRLSPFDSGAASRHFLFSRGGIRAAAE